MKVEVEIEVEIEKEAEIENEVEIEIEKDVEIEIEKVVEQDSDDAEKKQGHKEEDLWPLCVFSRGYFWCVAGSGWWRLRLGREPGN